MNDIADVKEADCDVTVVSNIIKVCDTVKI